jgi:hypothetical protein
MKAVLPVIAVTVSVFAALYLAAAGWVRTELQATIKETHTSTVSKPVIYDGVSFATAQERDRYLARLDAEMFFPWTLRLPGPVSLLMSSMSFAYLGGVIGFLLRLAYPDPALKDRYAALVLSPLIGLVVLAASIVIPSALAFSEVQVRPIALLFLCLLGGLFSKHVVEAIQKRFEKAFDLKQDTKNTTT